MSQNDGNISNANGVTVRADLNNLFAAILTNSSGPTPPSTTYSFQFWADTTTNKLMQRNSANSLWIERGSLTAIYWGLLSLSGGEMTGALGVAAGTLANCGLYFAGDPNTGLIWNSNNSFSFVAAGTEFLRMTTEGGDFTGVLSMKVPVGTTAQRPTGATGKIRYNSTLAEYEGYHASAWAPLARNNPSISTKTSGYTTLDTDAILYLDATSANFNLTLHTPTYNQELLLIRTDDSLSSSRVVSIVGTINGEADWTLRTKDQTLKIQYSTALASWRKIQHITSFYGTQSGIDITGSTSNPTKGSTSRDRIIIRREGRYANLTYQLHQTQAVGIPAAGTAGSGTYQFLLPAGMTADTGTTISDAADHPFAALIILGPYRYSRALPASGLVYEEDGAPSQTTVVGANLISTTRFAVHTNLSGVVLGSATFPLSLLELGYSIHVRIPISGWKD